MPLRIGQGLLRLYREQLDKLPDNFLYKEATDVGLRRPLLIRMKHRGILTNKRMNEKEYVWTKTYV